MQNYLGPFEPFTMLKYKSNVVRKCFYVEADVHNINICKFDFN